MIVETLGRVFAHICLLEGEWQKVKDYYASYAPNVCAPDRVISSHTCNTNFLWMVPE